ncbi:MAG TPA: NAD(P)H-dependent oxidoreductase [Sphingobacteriaceae bacterium]|nr:NAD(P)H-dependent oxidoreductase [Sphingobacteriaceae bacterium]
MITIISGTNRPNSNSLKLAAYYRKRFAEKGAAAQILSLTDLPSDFITADMFGQRSPAFAPFQEMVTQTEKFVFIIPEYNGSFPGVLKTFVDACKFPDSFYKKKAALVGHSTGKYGNIRGVEHFTGVCNYIRLHVLPLKIHIPHIVQELDKAGQIFQADTLRFTDEQITEFIQF